MNAHSIRTCLGLMLVILAIRAGNLSAQDSKLTAEQTQELARYQQDMQRESNEGNFDKALQWANKALTLRRQVLKPNDPDVIANLYDLATLNHYQRNEAAAIRFGQEALALQEKTLGAKNPKVTRAREWLVGRFLAGGQFYDAERELRLLAAAYDANRDGAMLSNVLTQLAIVQKELSQLKEARRTIDKALQLYGKQDFNSVNLLFPKADILTALGEFEEARDTYRECQRIITENGWGFPLFKRMAIEGLARLAIAQGDFDAARGHYESILKDLPENNSFTLHALNGLTIVELYAGRPAQARQAADKAVAIVQSTFKKDDPRTALAYHNLSGVLAEMADYEAAVEMSKRALQIREKLSHPDIAITLMNLGDLYAKRGNLGAAKSSLLRALKIIQQARGDEHPQTAMVKNTLAQIHGLQGEVTEGQRLRVEAVKSLEAAKTREHLLVGPLAGLADAHLQLGDRKKAAATFRRALEISRRSHGDRHEVNGALLLGLAVTAMADGRSRDAIQRLDEALKADHNYLTSLLPGMSLNQSLRYVDRRQNGRLSFAVSAAFRAMKTTTDGQRQSELAAAAAEWMLNSKGRINQALVDQRKRSRALTTEQRQTANELTRVRLQLASLSMSTPEEGKEERYERLLKLYVEREQQLSEEVARFVGVAESSKWITVDDIRDELSANDVFVEFARYRRYDLDGALRGRGAGDMSNPLFHYAVAIVPKAGQVRLLDLGPAGDADEAIQQARAEVEKVATTKPTAAEMLTATNSANERLRQVAKRIYYPLADQLNSAKRLILSPDANLWLIPWAALPVARGGKFSHYLVEDKVLSLSNGARSWLRPQNGGGVARAVVVADPDFSLAEKDVRSSLQRLFGGAPPNFTPNEAPGFGIRRRLGPAARLPHTAAEANLIAPKLAQYTGRDVAPFTGQFALETVCKRPGQVSILVLATHGFHLSAGTSEDALPAIIPALLHANTRSAPVVPAALSNPLLRGGLLFAGCNRPPQSPGNLARDDGVLTGIEIVDIDLAGVELVVLSACETGLGGVLDGEGIAGLRQAFHLAGASNVVATLWKIPEQGTALLMNGFIGQLSEVGDGDVPEALARAQREQIKRRRERYNGAAHPFFWAAFNTTR